MLRRRKKVVQEKGQGQGSGIDEELEAQVKSFSWWTNRRKALGAAMLAAILGIAGYGTYRLVEQGKRRSQMSQRYDQDVEDAITPYLSYGPPSKAIDACIVPGSAVDVFRESRYSFGSPVKRLHFSSRDEHRVDSPPCILPADGSQHYDLESRVRIAGIGHDDLNRSLISSTGIILEPQIPDILTPKFSVRKISVNGKAIPLSYLSIRPPSVARGSHYYLDISRLAKDGVLSEADFDRPLDVRIRSSAVSKAPKKGLVYLLLADKGYKDLPDYVKQHTLSTEKFPADHDGVQALVRAYNGPDEMMAKLLYTLLVTDNILEYKVQEDDLPLSRVFQRGEGDCSEYSNLFVSMARAFGIPARKRTGAVLDDDGKVDGYHAWVEVLVPLKGGVGEWMLVEPTWADDKARPFDYVSYQTRKHVYFVDFDVSLVGGDVRSDYSVFQHHMWVSRARKEGGKDGG